MVQKCKCIAFIPVQPQLPVCLYLFRGQSWPLQYGGRTDAKQQHTTASIVVSTFPNLWVWCLLASSCCTGNDATYGTSLQTTIGKQIKEHYLQISILLVIVNLWDCLNLVYIPRNKKRSNRYLLNVCCHINTLSIIRWAKQGIKPLQSLYTALFSFLACNTSRFEVQMLSASGHKVPFNGHYLWVPHSQAAWSRLCSLLSRDV